MKSALKKLCVIVGIVVVLLVGALVDLIISKTYDFEFVSVERLTEAGAETVLDKDGNVIPSDWGIADGRTYVRFVIRLTRNGKPVKGHTLYVKTKRNVLGRVTTDENGLVTVDYRCYKGREGNVKDVVLTVRDEDNSVFVFVPTTESYTLKMAEVKLESGSGLKTDDIFYDIN